jgi:hypothetical protein
MTHYIKYCLYGFGTKENNYLLLRATSNSSLTRRMIDDHILNNDIYG